MSSEGALTLHKVACSRPRGGGNAAAAGAAAAGPVSARELEEAEAFHRFRKKHEEFFAGDGIKVGEFTEFCS